MSKKKNTLKDLDEFLKQQAATLVTPAPLTTGNTSQQTPPPSVTEHASEPVTAGKILSDLKALTDAEGPSFRKQFYDLIIQTVESQKNSSPEDKMLINTALYLKNGGNWKNAIKEYWQVIDPSW